MTEVSCKKLDLKKNGCQKSEIFKDLKYIRNLYDIELYINSDIYVYEGSINSLVNYMCRCELRDYKTVRKITREVFKLGLKVPIYIRDGILLLMTGDNKHYGAEIINYYNVDNIYKSDSNSLVVFKDGTEYISNVSYNSLNKLMKTCENIKEYFEKRYISK